MGWYVVAAKVAMQLINGASAAKSAAQQNIAQNKMVQTYNSKVMYETLQQVTQINLERAQQRQQTTAALFNAGLQGQSARDQITTQAAATDTIGASVRDAISTVNQKQSQAAGSIDDQYMRAIDQSNLMLQKTIDQGSNSLKDSVADNSTAIMNQAGWGAIGSIIGQAAGDYASKSGGGDAKPAPISQAQGTPTGSYDYQGLNTSNSLASQNPFGLSFGFQSSNLLSK